MILPLYFIEPIIIIATVTGIILTAQIIDTLLYSRFKGIRNEDN